MAEALKPAKKFSPVGLQKAARPSSVPALNSVLLNVLNAARSKKNGSSKSPA
jgi:hypothetical protein